MYVLDTNTLICFFKGMGNVAENLLATHPKDIGIPAIVLYELEHGILKSNEPGKRTKQLKELVSLVNVMAFSHAEAKAAASVRATLESRGKPIGPYDTLIAGTAISRNGTLVTRNTKEFRRIPRLSVENWY